MTDRDHFAAAALTGLLSNVQRYQNEPLTRQAYEIADFMLRERGRAVTAHDAAPAARAETSVKEPMVHATGEPGGEPDGTIGTGKQPAPPCVETDGFSPGSSSELINRSAERESPRRECEESQLRDVPQQDNCRAAGGPEHRILEHQLAIARLAAENERLRDELRDAKAWAMSERSQRWALPAPLTDEEREAVLWAAAAYERRFQDRVGFGNDGPDRCGEIAATLRKLLERTK